MQQAEDGEYPIGEADVSRVPAGAFGSRIPKATADQLAQLMQEQQKATKAQEEQLRKLVNPGETDLSPLLALADSWTGSSFSKNYLNPREKAKLAADVQGKIANEKGNMIRNLSYAATRGLASDQNKATPDWRVDRIVQQAADSIHKAPNMKPYVDFMNNLGSDYNTLNQPMVTNTMVNEVLQGLARAVSRSNVASDYRLRSIELPTLRGYMNDVATLITSDPDRPAPPKVVDFAKHMAKRLFDNYDLSVRKEARRVAQGRKFRTPEANQAVGDAVDYYHSGAFGDELRSSYGLGPMEDRKAGNQPVSSNTQGQGQNAERSLVKKQYNSKLNKTKLIYSDKSEEVVDGQR
jgi:hypothetical protein